MTKKEKKRKHSVLDICWTATFPQHLALIRSVFAETQHHSIYT